MSTSVAENKTNFLPWVVLAVLARVICMLIAAHTDTVYISYFAGKMASNGVFDIYQYIKISCPGEIWTYYPPLTYFVLGGFQLVYKLLNVGLCEWLQHVYLVQNIGDWMRVNGTPLVFFEYLFLMKLPYLLFDLLMLAVMLRYMDNAALKMRAMKLWCFNPVILFGVYMMGQVDIMPTALVMLALLLIKREKIWWGLFIVSASAFFKTFAIFMIAPFFIVLTRSGKDILKNITAIVLPMALVLIPFFLSSGSLVVTSLFPNFSHENTGAIGAACFFAQRAIFLGLYFVIILKCFQFNRTRDDSSVLKVAVAVLMLVYVLFFVPIHYFVWIIPFLIVAVCYGILPEWLYWAQMICLFLYALNGPGTTTRLLSPLNPAFFANLPGLPDIMHGLSIKWGLIMLMARLMFISICVFIAMSLMGLFTKTRKPLIGGIDERS